MNCYRHHEKSAVSTCGTCGNGLCPTCLNVSNKFEKKPICNSCYREYLENKLTKIKKDKKWSIITVCTLGITGLPLVFSFMEDTPEQKLAKEIERVRSENDRNYTPTPASSLSSNLLFILLLLRLFFQFFFLFIW